jgi:oligopeptide transport system permease protein
MKKIPAEKFAFVQQDKKIYDKKLETKPIGYFKDAWLRFKKDKSAVIAMWLIILLLLFAIIVPEISDFNVLFRDGYYKMVLPKCNAFIWLGWDGCKVQRETQAGYDYLNGLGQEYGSSAVKDIKDVIVDETTGKTHYTLDVDTYEKVGFTYAFIHAADYDENCFNYFKEIDDADEHEFKENHFEIEANAENDNDRDCMMDALNDRIIDCFANYIFEKTKE